MDQTLLSTPAASDRIYIDTIAWPIGTAVMPEPLIVNDQQPVTTAPQILCMSGCPSPPCWPVSACPVPDLFWAARFTNLSVAPNFFARLPDMPVGGAPQMLMVLYDTAAPSPSVTPSVTSSPSVTPSVTPSPSMSVSPTPAGSPSMTATPMPRAPIAGGTSSESPHATPAAVVFGILFGAASIVIFGCWYRSQKAECPFCAVRVGGAAAAMRTHLKTCPDHLALYQPFVTESVQVLPPKSKKAWMPPQTEHEIATIDIVTEEKSDLLAVMPQSVAMGEGRM